MDNSDFYVAAVTVIPLLLIAIMATRSLRPGELRQQPTSTMLIFGLPVIGEVAAFSFLFFAPVPTAVAAVLAAMTWAGILSQLAVAVWWLAELVRREPPSSAAPVGQAVESQATAPASRGSHITTDGNPETLSDRVALFSRIRAEMLGDCPYCGAPLNDSETAVNKCAHCGRYIQR